MKIDRKKLTSALNRLNSVRDRTTAIPVLKCVKLTETQSRITLEATDLVRTVVVEVAGAPPALKDAAHSCLVNFDTLYKTARTAPKDVTDIGLSVVHDFAVTITAGKLKLAANASKRLSDWPEPDSSPAPLQSWSVEADDLKEWLDHCVSSISTEEVRYYLNGIYFDTHEKQGGKIHIVATDGHRMAVHEAERPNGLILPEEETGFIVRRACALAWRDMIRRGEWQGTLFFTKQGRRLVIECSKSQAFEMSLWQTNLIDGKFPDWEKIVPTTKSHKNEISRQDLLDVVKQVAGFNLVRDALRFEWYEAGIIAYGVLKNDTNDKFEMVVGDPTDNEIKYNTTFKSKYLLDVCNTLANAESLIFELFAEKRKNLAVIWDADRCDKYIVLVADVILAEETVRDNAQI